ncbi:hypothetical protein JCM8547_005561 [Rhodosporidiobolus lusitaniae]
MNPHGSPSYILPSPSTSSALPVPPAPIPPPRKPSSASPGFDASNVQAHASSTSSTTTARAKDYVPVKVGEGAGAKRSAKACQYCRRGKARCTGEYPCRRCRENGVVCVFEGMSQKEMKERAAAAVAAEEAVRNSSQGEVSKETISALESRLIRMEQELNALKGTSERHEARLGKLDDGVAVSRATSVKAGSEGEGSKTSRATSRGPSGNYEGLERESFDLFWEMYAPLAPYIDPANDTYDNLLTRSPLLLHCIVAVSSRLHENREFVEYQRAKALRLIRETLYSERTVTLDDLKGTLVYNAWLGKAAPPGHSVSLALQLDLPKCLERLLASITGPPEEAARAFEQHMPGVRSYLTLYAQDLWLSFAMGRRSLVTVDLAITSARLLLNFAALRPVDARLIAQSEIVTILGVIQESFLKTAREAAQTVHLVNQANQHLETWGQTWRAYAEQQEGPTSRYILASFSVLLQGGRFYINTLGLRDITKAEELMPEHLGCLRTALDAAVRIQGIHPAQKIAHSAEFTLVTLGTAALFLLKMIKLAPHAFSPVLCPSYPSFSSLASTPSNVPYDAYASSPDVSASALSFSTPSISQALDAARHSAKLLANAPARQRSYAQAVEAALDKLEGEMSQLPPLPPLGVVPSLSSSNGGGGVLGKRPLEEENVEGEQRTLPPPTPSASFHPLPPPSAAAVSTDPFASPGTLYPPPPSLPPTLPLESGSTPTASDLGLWPPASGSAGDFDASGALGLGGEGAGDEMNELTIASLIGTDSFWSWTTSLPGESIQPFIS